MCRSAEKSRMLKMLMAEIRAKLAKRKAEKSPKHIHLPGKPVHAAVAGIRK